MKIILFCLCAFLIILQYKLWLSKDGVAKTLGLSRQIQMQKAQNETLRERNFSIIKTINNLQKNGNETEAIAREQLGMIKNDEMFYRIVDTNVKK